MLIARDIKLFWFSWYFTDNLYGRTVDVDISPYINEDYWGVRDDEHMPVITVTFNTNGTTTVDYPEEE